MSKTFQEVRHCRTRGPLRSDGYESNATKKRPQGISRRDFLKTAGALALAAGTGASIVLPGAARASKKKLKILQWTHTESDFIGWFWNYCKDWGNRNDVEVEMKQTSE